jgi:hypothetical protein
MKFLITVPFPDTPELKAALRDFEQSLAKIVQAWFRGSYGEVIAEIRAKAVRKQMMIPYLVDVSPIGLDFDRLVTVVHRVSARARQPCLMSSSPAGEAPQ